VACRRHEPKMIYYMSFLGGLIDDFGHGSHTSADIAGYLGIAPRGRHSGNRPDDVRFNGVAPQARLMDYKACDGCRQLSQLGHPDEALMTQFRP